MDSNSLRPVLIRDTPNHVLFFTMSAIESIAYKAGELSGTALNLTEKVAAALRLDQLAKSTYATATKRDLVQDQVLARLAFQHSAAPIASLAAVRISEATAKIVGGDPKNIQSSGEKLASKYTEGFITGYGPHPEQEAVLKAQKQE